MKKTILLTLFLTAIYGLTLSAQQYTLKENIPYRDSPSDDYQRERCFLDVYYPEGEQGFATVVWFHGGGLTGGQKEIPALLKNKGVCVVPVNYRLSPRVHAPAYFDDAAAAVAWVAAHIAEYGGDPDKIYVAGHSAGGYLASMIALDKSWLAAYGYDADRIKGWVPISGQGATHWQVCRERGDSTFVPVLDQYAPIRHVRPNTPPILLTAGQTDMEMDNRTVENRYLLHALETVGNKNVRFYQINGFNHGNVVEPSLVLLLQMVKD